MFKFVIAVASCLAAANAGHLGLQPLAYNSYAYSSPTIYKTAGALPLTYAPTIGYSSPTTIVKSHVAPIALNNYATAYNNQAVIKSAAALPVTYTAQAPIIKAAPLALAAPAPIIKAAPLAYAAHATPLAYAAQPLAYSAHPAPLSYSAYSAHPAPLSYSAYSAGIVKAAAPLAYSAPLW